MTLRALTAGLLLHAPMPARSRWRRTLKSMGAMTMAYYRDLTSIMPPGEARAIVARSLSDSERVNKYIPKVSHGELV